MCSNPGESELTYFRPESNRGSYGLLNFLSAALSTTELWWRMDHGKSFRTLTYHCNNIFATMTTQDTGLNCHKTQDWIGVADSNCLCWGLHHKTNDLFLSSWWKLVHNKGLVASGTRALRWAVADSASTQRTRRVWFYHYWSNTLLNRYMYWKEFCYVFACPSNHLSLTRKKWAGLIYLINHPKQKRIGSSLAEWDVLYSPFHVWFEIFRGIVTIPQLTRD